ncbi:GMC family oxidoreductase [Streptomyces sp. NPDC102274]|uniref:GMC family oxidoreductase n=1 Tax=Streptomyces sp. NPDC102274 TaxID=3366151 RepID=UPI0037FFAB16
MRRDTKGYDYIVVGGGTAGCVLAAWLSEMDSARVLLLEAGSGQQLEAMAIPPDWPTLLQTSANWGDTTVKQTATGTPTLLARGRGLGGSSRINAMLFARGHRSVYDAWASAGATGWGFEDLLPYMKRCENAVARSSALRGLGGPLTVAPADPPGPLHVACMDAAEKAGYPLAADISSGTEEGFGWVDLNIVDGKRQSAADAYLAPARHRTNLDVVTDALVHRVRVEGSRCTGVEYSTGRERVSVDCSGDVVLTAGTIGSSQLLLLSGIGPRAHLEEIGVEIVLDLPGVGDNLHDHPVAGVAYTSAQPVPTARNNHGEAIGLLRSDPGLETPDFLIVFNDMAGVAAAGDELNRAYSILTVLATPRSRGTLRLASADPSAAPVIDPNYFGDDHDLTTMISALRAARRIGQATPLNPWRGQEIAPGPDVQDEAEFAAYIDGTLASIFHPVGTCRIGSDDLAVVDTELRLHGISGLRVADASVMPSIVTNTPNATVYAIAERAAELIRS